MRITCMLAANVPGGTETSASVAGDTLTVDGTAYVLALAYGAEMASPDDEVFAGPIRRDSLVDGGDLHVNLIWRYDPATSMENQATTNPIVDCIAGTVSPTVARKT